MQNGKIENDSLFEAWNLTIHATLTSTKTIQGMMATSVKLTTTLLNSSPSSRLVRSQNVMAPNNGTLTSQALPFPSNNVNSQCTVTNGTSVPPSEYETTRIFLENSKLHAYLAKKDPNSITLERRSYSLYEVS